MVVVNYATADLAIRAVESVLSRDHGGRAVEVHLVDNASPGDDAARLAEAHAARGWGDRVRLWPEPSNLGFGRGNNLVLSHLLKRADPPEFAFLLNPDAMVEGAAIDILARALEADARAAVAGPALTDESGGFDGAAFRFPTLPGEVMRTAAFGPFERLFGPPPGALPADTPEGPVDWISGTAAMLRMEALSEVGVFDPAYFLYHEELDLMRRFADAGWRHLYVPRAKVIHAVGAATGNPYAEERARRKAYVYDSWRIYFAKHHGRPRTALAAAAMMGAGAFNVAHRRIRGLDPTVPRHFFGDHWRHVLRPLLTGRAP